MEIRPCSTAAQDLARYAALFGECFPGAKHLDLPYLHWLYAENPDGEVIGMDAWFEGRMVAHYACVPVRARLRGVERRALLSVNTATHPRHQGQGLFTRLAEATYVAAADLGFHAVHGVANAQSTPGFVRKLGFTALSPLAARVGFGAIDERPTAALQASAAFHRVWSAEALRWRGANPHRPFRWHRPRPGTLAASAATGHWGIRAWAELPDTIVDAANGALASSALPAAIAAPRLHLGLRPDGAKPLVRRWIDVPSALRPSPLNLIFRSLTGEAPPASDAICFDFLDFDAY
jgi:GNAT superfamily N-acetyltransferase